MSKGEVQVWTCLQCSQRARVASRLASSGGRVLCPRCGGVVDRRKPNSVNRTWALLIAAVILYIPANVYPFLTFDLLSRHEADTLLVGIRHLFESGMWGVAIIIFFASILVPLLKIIGLALLLLSVQFRLQWKPVFRTRMYRIIEGIGRWSMIDVFVVSLMIALVSFGQVASIEAG
ncbi:MAG: paraquat-inducible protein A, partial [Myxococcota bacterium]